MGVTRLATAPMLLSLILGLCGWASAEPTPWDRVPAPARWELQMLGVTGPERLAELRVLSGERVVTIAIVGQGGISKSLLAPYWDSGNSFSYRSAPGYPDCDPGTNTHDTQEVPVVLDLTGALGVRVRILSYQPGEDYPSVARDLAAAGEHADIVLCFESFWGDGVRLLTDAIRSRPGALYVCPYAETEGLPTSTSLEGNSTKPWGGGLPNLITCAPLAQRGDGSILEPLNRDANDTEIINLIAPSYYANGPGGTCPSASVTAAVAAYFVAASSFRPAAAETTALLRRCVCVDEAAIRSAPPFTAEHVARLRASIEKLLKPGPGGPRKLDAAGVLSLREVHKQIGRPRS